MRLTCPNCDAQYEVDNSAIPDTGRDVQCSNCGHVWYQYPPGLEPAEIIAASETESAEAALPDLAPAAEPASDEIAGTTARAEAQKPQTPETAGAATQADDSGADVAPATHPDNVPQTTAVEMAGGTPFGQVRPQGDDDEAPPPEVPPGSSEKLPPRPALDASVLAILHEEAEREAEARRADERAAAARHGRSRGLELQGDLGLDAGPRAETVPVAESEDDTTVEEEPTRAAARRDLLPDIEQINSTLRASGERRKTEATQGDLRLPETADEQQRGFRNGFLLIIALAVVLVLGYVYAPRIVTAVPATAPVMSAYVEAVTSARRGLDAIVESALRALQGAE